MICVQNVFVEPILISLNQIMTEFLLMLVAPFDDLSSIMQRPYMIFIIYHYHVIFLANSAGLI